MSETEEDDSSTQNFDLHFDSSYTFDQIFSPSFILPATDQSLSPIWTFSDDGNNNFPNAGDAGNATLTSSEAAHRLVLDPDIPDHVTTKLSTIDGKTRLSMPILDMNPSEYQDATCIIKERMGMALRYFIDMGEQHVLAQIWVPVKTNGRYVLTTCGQPFAVDPNCNSLHHYRIASLMYVFSLDSEADGLLDIVGRVFIHKLPEWTPNVQYFKDKEYQRLNHALHYNVRGTLALPVFEPSGHSCVGVIELVLTSQKINFAPEIKKLCNALEAVNMKSSTILDSPNMQASRKMISNKSRQNALAEILEVLAVVCVTFNFPFAQTWVPCRHQSVLAYGGGFKNSCNGFDGRCMGQICMSATDIAFYVIDPHMWGFREACAEHHLQKGQGVAGRAFENLSSCFCENITHLGKAEYPLVHFARLFGLVGSFAMCLRSSHTGDDDYIVEFFLPPNMIDRNQQESMLGSLMTSMKQNFHSLKVSSGKGFGDGVLVLNASRNAVEVLKFLDGNRPSTPLVASEGGTPLVEECIIPSKATCKTTPISLHQEDIKQQFGRTMKEAAKNLNVSVSTLKRKCKSLGISKWQGPKIVKKKVNDSYKNQSDTNEVDKEAIGDSLTRKGGTGFDMNLLTIKAEYLDDLIKFDLPMSLATLVAIKEQIGTTFKLSPATYKLKYLDEDVEWILMASDQDLRYCITSLRILNKTAIRLRVLPMT